MSGFTPGPWEVGPVDDTVVTHLGADGVRYEIAAIDGDYNQPDEWPVMEANARLIAAAPDLLEALQKVVSCFDIKDGLSVRDEQAIKHAASVIHKATGAAA